MSEKKAVSCQPSAVSKNKAASSDELRAASEDIPSVWLNTMVEEISSDVSYGYTASSTPEVIGPHLLRITDIQNNSVEWASVPYCKISTDKEEKYRLEKGDLLFARTGATVGKSFLINSEIPNSVYASYLIRLRSLPGLDIEFLAHFFRSPNYWKQITEFSAGIGQPNVNGTKIKKLVLPLPPVAEQKVIPNVIKRFRQSVLSAAVSGKLTEEWRGGTGFGQWRNTVFSDICREITVGFVGKMKDKYIESGIPFLRSQNVRAFKFDDKNILYISNEFHREIYKSRLENGDLAIVRSGAPGTTCVIPETLGEANCSDLVIARPGHELLPAFGCIFMNSEIAQKNVVENQVGVAQQHFNVGSMKKFPIHLPPLDEQAEIVNRVEKLFAFADQIEKQVSNAQQRVNNLTQSILAKAFRGELTAGWREQNPDLISGENSAEALLEKIKAEREKLKPATKSRKKK